MSGIIIIVGKDNHYPPHLTRGTEIVNEKEIDLNELIKAGRFFSRHGGCSSFVEGVTEAIKCDGWVIFAKKK